VENLGRLIFTFSNLVRFHVLTAASMKFRIVSWDVLPCKIIVDRRFRATWCLHHQGWRQHVPLNRRSTIILHGSTSQKTILNFIFEPSFSTLGRPSWTGDRPIVKPLPTHDNTPHKHEVKQPCFEGVSNSRSQCPSGQDNRSTTRNK
jgi:hypothetical protein